MKKICVVTGSRAEYGLMSRLMHLIDAETSWQLQIIATNTHLSPEFGLTYREIEADGFTIDRKVEMLLSSDTANGTAKSTGLGMIGLADAYESLQPDLIVLLGDRYEMLAAASAALLYKIPVAHISGGDVTEGAFDDAIRHSITKMSHLHFPSTEVYRNRIIQLGENPSTVFNVGALGVDNIRHLPLLGKEELENALSAFLVALDGDGNVAGYAGVQVILDEGYITNVAVRPDCRRQGVAGKLLQVFLDFARGNHLAFLTLEARASNAAAIALYESRGFQITGRRKNYYEHPREDAIIMTKEFDDETADPNP